MPLLLAGCGGPLSTLDPAGPAAASIATLWWVMFWGSAIISLGMFCLIAVAATRPQAAAGLSPRGFIVWGGLVFPSAVLAALLIFALAMGERLIPKQTGTAPMRIEVTARQWMWEVAYPEAPDAATSLDVLHIPAGRPVDIAVTSRDVIHSFWIPRLGGKIDAIPGHTNVIRLQADRPGSYRGVCAEFCGTGRTMMDLRVEAHAEEEYDAALRGDAGGAR